MGDEINRIVILEDKIKGDLSRCGVCGVNFTAVQPCIVCGLRIEREGEVGRGKKLATDFTDDTDLGLGGGG